MGVDDRRDKVLFPAGVSGRTEVAMAPSGSPVLGRRRLANDLRRLRLDADRTIADVAGHLECSAAKVSRMETGTVGVRIQDLRALADLYGLEECEREQLYALVRQARQRAWWHEFADVYPPESDTLYGLEDAAASIKQHSSSLIPGLLQTERYARALIGSAAPPPTVLERRVQLRLRRQRVLTRPRPPEGHFVVDEAVLRRDVGGRDVMSEQLDRLVEVGRRSNVAVQVLEFGAGVHPAVGVAFAIFDFAVKNVTPVVYQEQLSRNSYLDDPEEVEIYLSAWNTACRVASPVERSHELISSRARELR
ncbi:MAG: helix-turn-helix domain-containing protein [Pseudonocardia sp.]